MVKLLPCDHEVTGSSPGNSLLQKCRERLRTKDPSGRTLPLTLRKRELRALGLPFFLYSVSEMLVSVKIGLSTYLQTIPELLSNK